MKLMHPIIAAQQVAGALRDRSEELCQALTDLQPFADDVLYVNSWAVMLTNLLSLRNAVASITAKLPLPANLRAGQTAPGDLFTQDAPFTATGIPYLPPGMPNRVQIMATPAYAGSNVCMVTFQVQDVFNNDLPGVWVFPIWLSDDQNQGNGLTGQTPRQVTAGPVGTIANGSIASPSGVILANLDGTNIAGGTVPMKATVPTPNGNILGQYVGGKAMQVMTDGTGKFILSINDPGKNPYVPCAITPGTGTTNVGCQLAPSWYG